MTPLNTTITENKKELIILYLLLIVERQEIENKLKQGVGGHLLGEYFFIEDLIMDMRDIIKNNILNWVYM